jgi:hypothetical protein
VGLLDIFTLAKFKVSAYDTVDREGAPSPDKTFEAMYNPASFTQTYSITYIPERTVNTQKQPAHYSQNAPSQLSVELVLDGTGVEEMGIVTLLAPKTVADRITNFLDVAYKYNGAIHETNYLIVEFGAALPEKSFNCRLQTVTIEYTSFDRDGSPLRAKLKPTFITDESAKKAAQEAQNKSPDLTHSRIVRSGDTLPLLTKQLYGSSVAYLDVARFNSLDDFRSLTPGQEILFPPLATFGRGKGGRK